jgi:hypothetical protein
VAKVGMANQDRTISLKGCSAYLKKLKKEPAGLESFITWQLRL